MPRRGFSSFFTEFMELQKVSNSNVQILSSSFTTVTQFLTTRHGHIKTVALDKKNNFCLHFFRSSSAEDDLAINFTSLHFPDACVASIQLLLLLLLL